MATTETIEAPKATELPPCHMCKRLRESEGVGNLTAYRGKTEKGDPLLRCNFCGWTWVPDKKYADLIQKLRALP